MAKIPKINILKDQYGSFRKYRLLRGMKILPVISFALLLLFYLIFLQGIVQQMGGSYKGVTNPQGHVVQQGTKPYSPSSYIPFIGSHTVDSINRVVYIVAVFLIIVPIISIAFLLGGYFLFKKVRFVKAHSLFMVFFISFLIKPWN